MSKNNIRKRVDSNTMREIAGREWSDQVRLVEETLIKSVPEFDPSQPDEEMECFYCGAAVVTTGKGDHVPYPFSVGGGITVPCCKTCHEMKDSFGLDSWSVSWIMKIFGEFSRLSREMKIFLMKMFRIISEARHQSAVAQNMENIRQEVEKLIAERKAIGKERVAFEKQVESVRKTFKKFSGVDK